MSLDAKSKVTTAIYSSNNMNKTASATQVKRYSDANTSFATEMRMSSEQKEAENPTVEETVENDVVDKKEETRKTETKHSDKVAEKEHKSDDTIKGEVSSDNQAENNYQGQNSSQGGQQNPYTPLTSQIQAYMNANGLDMNFVCVNPMNATSHSQIISLTATVDYSNIKMSDTDAKFFADLVSKTDMTANSVAAEFEKQIQQGNIKMVQSTAKASAALIEALKQSAKNHQAFRVDFDKDISVILQVDKGGKINANFIPGDKAVEAYLRNNIDSLRQRFNQENIAYGDLTYSQSRRNRQEREQNNKEKH